MKKREETEKEGRWMHGGKILGRGGPVNSNGHGVICEPAFVIVAPLCSASFEPL